MNTLVLDFKDNPDLQSALAGKQPGDRVTLEIEVMVTAVDDEKFEGDVESITTEDAEGEEETAEVDADAPVMAVFVKRKKSKKSEKDEKSEEDEATE